MYKKILPKTEIQGLMTKCYNAEPDSSLLLHEAGDKGREYCIDISAKEFIDNKDITLFGLYNNNELIGYFGEELFKGERCLTGFFLMPNLRCEENKQEFWNIIKEHFNNSFRFSLYSKNIRAINFVLKNGCNYIQTINKPNGQIEIFGFNRKDKL